MLIVGIAIGAGIVYYISNKLNFDIPTPEVVVEEKNTILLEQVQKVYKMVAVEGQFADILTHEEQVDYYGYTIPGFSKKAFLKIKAKVLVGYNMDSLRIVMDHTNKVVRLEKWPEPEILAIDHDVSYYDLDNGWFNAFEAKDLTKLNKTAKDSIRAQAERSELFPKAAEQSKAMFDLITMFARESGWTVVYGELDSLIANESNDPNIMSIFVPIEQKDSIAPAPIKLESPHRPDTTVNSISLGHDEMPKLGASPTKLAPKK